MVVSEILGEYQATGPTQTPGTRLTPPSSFDGNQRVLGWLWMIGNYWPPWSVCTYTLVGAGLGYGLRIVSSRAGTS